MQYSLNQYPPNFSQFLLPSANGKPTQNVSSMPTHFNPNFYLPSSASLLGKRNFQDQDHPLLNYPEKKVKVSLQEEYLRAHNMSPISEDLLGHNRFPMGFPQNDLIFQNPMFKDVMRHMNQDIQAFQQAQYLQYMSMRNQFDTGQNQDLLHNSKILQQQTNINESVKNLKEEEQDLVVKPLKNNHINDKNEYQEIKNSKMPSHQKTNSNGLKAKHKGAKKKSKEERQKEQEPILAEFTKVFPDWDLATIFEFVKSGKSKENFEKDRKTRKRRKYRTGKKKTLGVVRI
jgi:hypothetical protein